MHGFARGVKFEKTNPNSLQIQPVPALIPIAALVEGVSFGDGDDTCEGATQSLAGFSAGPVVGVGGDPDAFEAVGFGQWEDQSTGPLGQAMASGRWMDAVADVADVGFQVVRIADAQREPAGDLGWRRTVGERIGDEPHPEVIAGNDPPGWVGQLLAVGGDPEEFQQPLAGDGTGGGIAFARGVSAGAQERIDPLGMGRNQLQLAIDQVRSVEKSKAHRHDEHTAEGGLWHRLQRTYGLHLHHFSARRDEDKDGGDDEDQRNPGGLDSEELNAQRLGSHEDDRQAHEASEKSDNCQRGVDAVARGHPNRVIGLRGT